MNFANKSTNPGTPYKITTTPRQHLSFDAMERLRAFSAAEDKTTLRPEDWERWNAFVIQMHRDDRFVEPELLDHWLSVEGWPEGPRAQLLLEYYKGLSLLGAYDEEVAR